MKYILQNIDDITDSREVLESRPHPFTRIFIYIMIAVLLLAFIWSYFSEKEIVVKANGIVEPNKAIIQVSNEAAGKVTSINFKDGDKVKKDQILYTINHTNLDVQKAGLEEDLKLQNVEVNNLNKLKNSITDGKNHFNENSNDEREYYNRYVRYTEGIGDINNSAQAVKVQIQNLQDQILKLNLLQKSINDNKNYFGDNSSYSNQLQSYQINIQQYQGKINNARNQYNALKKQIYEQKKQTSSQNMQNSSQIDQNNEISEINNKSQLDNAKIAIDSANQDLSKYKLEFMQNINSSKEQNEIKIKEIQSAPSLSQENGSQYTSSEEYKHDNLIQIDTNIKAAQSKINQDNNNIKSIDINIAQCTVKAPSDGIINSLNEIKEGDLLQAGTQIATMLPIDNSQYKIQIYIANKDIGNIKKGQNIRCNFDALPYSDYGSIDTKITNLSADAKVNQNNSTSYYTAEAIIYNKPLYNRKREKADIKPGMTSQIDIITRKEKILYYLMKQINLKD
ncbi:HlyD family efflux transporter periplasmic adaptor subunit [Clostridium pasteurianum]|uniref:HlyD family efflux transporter periplasmic adaptor subunit n=1 Tax=Clostridium pasteurianum TaxID=1501 RepID=UPI002260C5A9|nr:HlyD family efflux transporter periplasmic adaptor subunit [Clostridium pasteurianum]UZW14496.1 HlyD family efflux transporter periplasmic adaptor subunit [Clostridium pasteurianum]